MVVCQYYQQGRCRYGDSCKFEHPKQNNNRFGVFGSGSGTPANPSSSGAATETTYNITTSQIQKDLTEELPRWIFSAYGPGRDAPDQLFGGYPTEQSFEELRLHHLKGVMSGNPQGAVNEIDNLYREAQQRIQNALNNKEAAIRYILDGANKHPNRIDICQTNTLPGGTTGEFAVDRQRTSPFGGGQAASNPFSTQPIATTTSAFGQPSTSGPKPNPFGTPAFGQPSQPSSAFGQPSQLGGGASAFGQPSKLGGGSAFGQASALGQTQSAFGTPSFGKPAQPSGFGAPAFGQPSQPSQPGSQGMSGFGQLGGGGTGAASASPFGQPSALGPKPSVFGGGSGSTASPFSAFAGSSAAAPGTTTASPFAQAAGTAAPSPFAQAAAQGNPSPFGTAAAPSTGGGGVFGKPAAAPNVFGQPSTAGPPASSNPFSQSKPSDSMDTSSGGASAVLGQQQQQQQQPPAAPASNPFQQARVAASANPFGQPSTTAMSTPFGQAAAAPAAARSANPYGPDAKRQHPAIETYSTRDGLTRKVLTFLQKNVMYEMGKDGVEHPVTRNFDGSTVRIWFPDGPPPYYKDTELEDSAYDAGTRRAYEEFMATGKFPGGVMPELPPKREWCSWTF